MFSVVVTEVIQFFILATSSIVLGIIAMSRVTPEMLHKVIPAGWDNPFFGWRLDLDWSSLIASVNAKIADDGYSIFGFFFMMLLFKGFPGERRGTGAQLRHAAHPFDAHARRKPRS